MKRKILSVVLCLCMVMTLLPTMALAEGEPTPTAALILTAETPAEGNGYSWDGSKLTLFGVGIDLSSKEGSDNAITLPAGSTVELVGYNKLKGNSAGGSLLSCNGNLTIGGSGILELTNGGYGINCNDGNNGLTINGGYITSDIAIKAGAMTVNGGYLDVSVTDYGFSAINSTTYIQSAG